MIVTWPRKNYHPLDMLLRFAQAPGKTRDLKKRDIPLWQPSVTLNWWSWPWSCPRPLLPHWVKETSHISSVGLCVWNEVKIKAYAIYLLITLSLIKQEECYCELDNYFKCFVYVYLCVYVCAFGQQKNLFQRKKCSKVLRLIHKSDPYAFCCEETINHVDIQERLETLSNR